MSVPEDIYVSKLEQELEAEGEPVPGHRPRKGKYSREFAGISVEIKPWDPVTNPVGTMVIEGATCRVELLNQLKSGKEATVYCCRATSAAGERLIAVKRFIALDRRDFRNDAIYRAGRWREGSRQDRAVRNRSEAGQGLQFEEWVGHEYATLVRLHAGGVDVPRPLGRDGSMVLMEYLGDEERIAPLLHRVRPSPEEAKQLHDRVLRNIRLMLALDCVHGDLSAYNILYSGGLPVIIDFPQSVDPRHNPNAEQLLVRDLVNISAYFARHGVETDPAGWFRRLWDDYVRGRM